MWNAAHKSIAAATAAAVTIAAGMAAAQQTQQISAQRLLEVITNTWPAPTGPWPSRIAQDATQRACSDTRNAPKGAAYDAILAREKATLAFPADGIVLGDWRAGEQVAQTGTGGQFSDQPETPRGGNCYACHQMAPDELSFGTLGPSLTSYGKIRNYAAADASAAYAKIYNAQSVLPCSIMPRFGVHNYLSEKQIKDVTAFLFDPESPVNKP